MIAGICGGIGEYLDIDPTLIRVAAVIISFISFGGFLVAYVLLIWVIPEKPVTEGRKKVDNQQK